jgi:hypothetical protein
LIKLYRAFSKRSRTNTEEPSGSELGEAKSGGNTELHRESR